jgi:predicted signal transduction protein with EAL and GGDEF domain
MTGGATDDIGMAAMENRVSVADWHAIILHCLGPDHHKLVYNRNGLDERLTSVFEARAVKEILAWNQLVCRSIVHSLGA